MVIIEYVVEVASFKVAKVVILVCRSNVCEKADGGNGGRRLKTHVRRLVLKH